jgi:natural product precursor
MKKLGKLNLKAEKMLKKDELVSYKGGSAYCTCTFYYTGGGTS